MIINMRIKDTRLGYEDHGIFTCLLVVEGDDIYGNYGGYALDNYNPETRVREATAIGFQSIINIINVVGVNRWEELKGSYIRCEIENNRIVKIGNLIKNIWFDFEQFFNPSVPAVVKEDEPVEEKTEQQTESEVKEEDIKKKK